MAETLFEELKRYVGFGARDEAALRGLYPLAKGRLVGISETFYAAILAHEGARKVFKDEAQVGRLKVTLVAWMDSLLQGPWDAAYYERRARIGRMHVQIDLPQHYMFGAMNVVRREFEDIASTALEADPARRSAARAALARILDLELAIMLHTYREDLLARQARSERLSTFGQLVGSIGHELRNPLSVIETSLYILRGRLGEDAKSLKHADRISEQLAIANDIITKLLDMIRDRPLQRERVDLGAMLSSLSGTLMRPPEVSLSVTAPSDVFVSGDGGQLRQVFANLIENGVHAAQPTGAVTVVGRVDGADVEIAVQDSGSGVDPAIRGRLFEPLVTTKAKGIGLGLALVKRIVERHGGTIRYEPAAPHGARFVVRLPGAGGET